jgi:hypothetical protein
LSHRSARPQHMNGGIGCLDDLRRAPTAITDANGKPA